MNDAIDCIHNLDLRKFYVLHTIIYEMVKDRNYIPLQPMMTKKEWNSKFTGYIAQLDEVDSDITPFNIIDDMALLFTNNKKRLLVCFHPFDSNFCQKDMNYIHNFMTKKNAQHLIVIVNNKATPKVLDVINILGPYTQLFNDSELLYNLTEHQLVSKHSLVTGQERETILNCYARDPEGNLRLESLPGMYTNDPVARFYNFKINDLIKVKRMRPDGFYDLSYRIVTKPVTDKEKNK